MARQESDREDLLREATALVERVELVCGASETIVIGFRAEGSGSIYFGQDPALHFNPRSELRRAFVDGELIKAEGGRLVSLTRERTAASVNLMRREWDEPTTHAFLERVVERLTRLGSCLQSGDYAVQGKVPADAPVERRAARWLAQLVAEPIRIAAQPGLR